MKPVDGVLLDLGVSSPQLDDGRRGFSFMHDGPLDMRMDRTRGQTAQSWLERAEEKEIARVISRYGEERFARRIARAVVRAREEGEIDSTSKLAQIVGGAVPKREQAKHPATRTLRAIRIYINGELEALEVCLESIVDVLASGGRLVVISFHSLEDRIVKRFMRNLARGEQLPDRLPVRDADIKRTFRLVGKPVKPGEDELGTNRRARSSIMRVAEKL
ncbi:MAG: 16S rRNA (cytosine(1402)-N(4))-methyltransferase RsmH [Gammaproteobacteria bacterium]|nr:16S rRNA (cytosine(1402)-N(4))-methyltransferase RsmH [Gammaproteobacteria bacterium]